ncbi:MAG: hypothetical protein LQ351_004470 [Letrouitia transgressa]|nr:MAG: hypothetical protein LQ351_004470 [Letrouitia transgressa]
MGKTPLHFAAARGDLDAVSTLLRHEADPNLVSDALWTPLHEAAISSNHQSFRPLLMAGAQVDAFNNRGQNALSLAAYVRDDVRYIDALLEYNTNVHLADKTGLTALHRACIRNRVQSAKRLIDLQVDIDALDEKGLSPVHTCVLNNSHDVLKVLLDSGARADRSAANGRTLLHDVAAIGNLSSIAIISSAFLSLDGLNPDAVDEDGRTAQEILNSIRPACVSESEEERTTFAFAFRILLDRLMERNPVALLEDFVSEKIELQSTISEEEFFETMDRMESSIESLHIIKGLTSG